MRKARMKTPSFLRKRGRARWGICIAFLYNAPILTQQERALLAGVRRLNAFEIFAAALGSARSPSDKM